MGAPFSKPRLRRTSVQTDKDGGRDKHLGAGGRTCDWRGWVQSPALSGPRNGHPPWFLTAPEVKTHTHTLALEIMSIPILDFSRCIQYEPDNKYMCNVNDVMTTKKHGTVRFSHISILHSYEICQDQNANLGIPLLGHCNSSNQ